jgi:hypothetical protein
LLLPRERSSTPTRPLRRPKLTLKETSRPLTLLLQPLRLRVVLPRL